MGYNAWDVDIKDFVDADDAVKKEKGGYLCPTEKCRELAIPVYLTECENGNHFSTLPGYADKHDKDCDFPSQQSEGSQYRKKIYRIFNIETLISNLKEKTMKEHEPQYNENYKTPEVLKQSQDAEIEITNLTKLYGAVIHNSLDFNITADYKVGDISISERNSETAKNPINKPVLFIGRTNGFVFNEKLLHIYCPRPNGKKSLKVFIYFDNESFLYIKSRLERISENYKEIRVAVLANFKSEDASFTNFKGEIIPYKKNFAFCSSGQIKIIDRVKADKQTVLPENS